MSIFTRFALRSLTANRTRTVVSVIGIALSCALICAVLTSVISMTSMLYERTASDEGTWQVEAAALTRDGYEKIATDGRVARHIEIAELGTVPLGDDNAADYGRWLFAKTWPENPAGERLVAEPEITSGRAPEAPGEIVLPHYLEDVRLAPCGLTVDGADGSPDAGVVALGSTVTIDLGTRTITDGETGESWVGTSTSGTWFSYDDDHTERFDGGLGRITGTVVGFYRSYGFSSTRALQGNSIYVYPDDGAVERALADGSAATCVYSIFTTTSPSDAMAMADELAQSSDAADGTATHNSLLRWQGITGDAEVWNTLYMIAGVLAAVIAVAGVSLVYNSFAISVAERTRQFGLLASLGASRRQLRRTVLVEALLLSAVGIPLGLALGLIGCFAVFQLTGTGLAAMFDVESYGVAVGVTVSPAALAISAALALITVLVSAWIPALRASRVSAVDAIRQTQDIRLTRRARRSIARRGRGAGGAVDPRPRGLASRLFGIPGFIAHRNLSRSTSKGRVTVAALAVSVALLIVSGLIGNVMGYASGTALNQVSDVDLAVNVDATSAETDTGALVREDGRVNDAALGDALSRLYEAASEGVDAARPAGWYASYVADALVPAQMVSEGSSRLFGDLLSDGSWSGPVYIDFVDDGSWSTYVDELGLSRDEFCDPAQPRAIALNRYDTSDGRSYASYSPLTGTGEIESVSFADIEGMYTGGILSDPNGTTSVWYSSPKGDERYVPLDEGISARETIEVGAVADSAPAGISTHTSALRLLLPASALGSLSTPSFADAQMSFDADGSAEASSRAQDEFDRVAADFPELDCTYSNFAQTKAQTRMMADTVQTFIYCFTVICGLIAVANVFNTLTNSLMLRRREFAVLKSVGMGDAAFRRMIAYECASYALRGFAIGVALAGVVAVLLSYAMELSFTTFELELPWAQTAIAAAVVLAVILVSVVYALHRSHAASVVEALREDAI